MTSAGGDRWTLYLAGNCWDDVAGTDQHLATALASQGPVLWVDPARSVLRTAGRGRRPGVDEVAPGVHRCCPVVPPAPSRPVARDLARTLVRRQVAQTARRLGVGTGLAVVTSPQAGFPSDQGLTRMLLVTDDWLAGADLMGLSPTAVRRQLLRNLGEADVVAAVSPTLADQLSALVPGLEVAVVPNGVRAFDRPAPGVPTGTAALVGQLNERLDLPALWACVEAGIPLRVVGPLAARDPGVEAELRALLRHPGVTWRGRVPAEEVAAELAGAGVGLTPYRDTSFNRASFPLKTLEYLAAGLPVVSTDLPSARWLDAPDVDLVGDPGHFAAAVRRRLDRGWAVGESEARIAFASRHTWSVRADQVRGLADAAIRMRSGSVGASTGSPR